MSYKVQINSSTNIILFKRMNQKIVDQCRIHLNMKDIPDMMHHMVTFEQTYGVKIHAENWGNWTHMEFPSEEAYTMAVLKWL